MRVVVVGGVAAGATFAAKYKRQNKNEEVHIIDKGRNISYATCGLPYYISDIVKDEEDLIISTPEQMEGRGVKVSTNTEVIDVDPVNKELTLLLKESGNISKMNYDKLVIASGCSAVKLPEFENKGDNVFILKNIYHGKRLKEYLNNNKVKTALIIGGGPTGIEIAENLVHKNIKVTILEKTDRILNQYDKETSNMVTKDLKKKCEIITNDYVYEVTDGKPFKVKLAKTEREFDIVIVNVGLIPNTAFLRNTNVEVSSYGYIFTNETFETNVDSIYAIGDVAIVKTLDIEEYIVPKLASTAQMQARILADYLTDQDIRYKGTIAASIVKIFDKTIAKVGINEIQAKDNGLDYILVEINGREKPGYYPDSNTSYIRAIFNATDLKLLGAEIYGSDGVDKRASILATAIQSNLTGYDLEILELPYSPVYSLPTDLINILGSQSIKAYKIKLNEDR